MHAVRLLCAAIITGIGGGTWLAGKGPGDDLARKLKSNKVELRLEAVSALDLEGGPDADKQLQSLLDDKDWEVVERAARALGKRGSASCEKALSELALEGRIRRIRRAAALSLCDLKLQSAVAFIASHAKDKSATACFDALEILAPIADDSARDAVQLGLKSSDVPVRAAAARAISVFAPVQQAEVLQTLAKDGAFEVYAGALECVARSPHPECLASLLDDLGAPLNDVIERRVIAAVRALFTATEGDARQALGKQLELAFEADHSPSGWAAWARLLGVLASKKSRPAIDDAEPALVTEAVAEPLLLLLSNDGRAPVRAASSQALGRLGTDKALERARILATSDPDARARFAAFAAYVDARSMQHPDAIALAIEVLKKDADVPLRERAAVELGHRDLKAAIPALIDSLSAPEWTVACCAAVSLGKVGNPLALDSLRKLYGSKDWKLRGAALVGLQELEVKAAIPDIIGALGEKPPALNFTAFEYLRRKTREVIPPKKAAWAQWWQKNQAGFVFEDRAAAAKNSGKFAYAPSSRGVYESLDVIVFQSRGDHIEQLLDQIGVPHRLTQSGQLSAVGVNPYALFVSNCTGEATPEDNEVLQWFVRTGGYLFCSCWALTFSAVPVEAGLVRMLPTHREVLDRVTAYPCAVESPYLRDVFDDATRVRYVLSGSHLIEVLDRERVEVLIDSPECATRWGGGNLAAWFRTGHGVVLDSANHFDLQGLAGAENLKRPEDRMIFAVDTMGVGYDEVREFDRKNVWNDETRAAELVRDLSAFRIITNFVRQKRLRGI